MRTKKFQITWLIAFMFIFLFQTEIAAKSNFEAWGAKILNKRIDIPSGWTKVKLESEFRDCDNSIKTYPQQDMLVFKNNYLSMIFEDSHLTAELLTDDSGIFASLGEYEPFSFTLRSFLDFKNLSIEVGDFKSEKNLLRKSNFDIRIVQPLIKKIYGTKTYASIPTVLEKINTFNLNKDKNLQFWLSIHIPPDTVPATYIGEIKIWSREKLLQSFKLQINVLPIKLHTPERNFQLYYSLSLADPIFPSTIEKELLDIREHGINSLALFAIPPITSKDGVDYIEFDSSINSEAYGLNDLVGFYMEAGFDNSINYSHAITDLLNWPSGGWKEYLQMYGVENSLKFLIKNINNQIKLKSWPDFIYGLDEPYPALSDALSKLEAIKEVEGTILVTCHGMYTNTDINQTEITVLLPWIDFPTILRASNEIVKQSQKVKSKNKELWFYNGWFDTGFGIDPAQHRFFYGMDAWRLEADGITDWNYHQGNYEFWDSSIPYGSITADYPVFAYGYPSPEGPVPTIAWEALREGIDDAKYIHTLELLIKQGHDSYYKKLPQVFIEAENFLNTLKWSLPTEYKDRTDFLKKKTQDRSFFNNIRWSIASYIIELQNTFENDNK